MLNVEDYEQIRRMYYVEHKSQRQIARATGHTFRTVKKALASPEPPGYRLRQARRAPVVGPFRGQLDELLAANEQLPRKQRYTVHKLHETLVAAGYTGSASAINVYAWKWKRDRERMPVFIPLVFDPGQDAQVDWGEAEVELDGERITAQLFAMRLCYSRRLFVCAYPTQRQEAFFEAHVRAFEFFGGAPRRLTYDNLTTAVQRQRVLQGHTRVQQRSFVAFRSHYLFEAQFCTPGEGHEKGGVEHGVGYARRNFLAGIPKVASWEALNALLEEACRGEDVRTVHGQAVTIGQAWQHERERLLPLPAHAYACCVTVEGTLNGYGQATFDTNRYSVPAEEVVKRVTIKAYPFRVDILNGTRVIASHVRSYERHQEIFDPLHYLSLLEQRPRAFAHARPIRQMRRDWPAVYEDFLAHLQRRIPDGGSVRQFVQVLALLKTHPAHTVEQAMAEALRLGCPSADAVRLCLHRAQAPAAQVAALDLAQHPQLAAIAGIGQQPVQLNRYEQLLTTSAAATGEVSHG
jgi:transposase